MSLLNRICIGLLFCSLAMTVIATTASGQAHMWSQRFGGSFTSGFEQGFDVAVDPDGNIVFTGYFYDTAVFGGDPLVSAGLADIIVAKYRPDGSHLWSRRFGGTRSDLGRSIAVDNDGNILVAGSFSGTVDFGGGPLSSVGFAQDLFVFKLDADGAHVWSRVFGSSRPEERIAVGFDTAGNALVTGQFQQTVNFGGGWLTAASAGDIFLAKYGPGGAHIWSQSFGPGGWDEGTGVVCDAAGNIYVGGRFEQTVDFGGGPRTGYNLFFAKYDPSGNYIVDRDFGGIYLDTCHDIALDNRGNILLTGFFRGTIDFGGGPITATGNGDIYVVKFDPSYTHVWSRGMGGTHTGLISLGRSIAADAAGNAIVTGYFNTTVDFGGGPFVAVGPEDIFLAKYDASGTHVWSRQFGGEDGSRSHGVAVSEDGNVVMTGGFLGAADFGGGTLVAAGNADLFLARYEGQESGMTVGLDIKPGSCPNPLNVNPYIGERKNGKQPNAVLPVALVGSEDFNIHDVDVSSLRLEGIAPLHHGYEDVSSTQTSDEDCACTDDGSDGRMDLTLKFRRADIIGALGGARGSVELTLTGNLYSGESIEATDCVWVEGGKYDDRPFIFSGRAPVKLMPAVPNPFNPVTWISYSLSEERRVRLSVFNVRGERVDTLVDERMPAGQYVVTWEAGSAPSGVYFYRLEAGSFVETRKMILLK